MTGRGPWQAAAAVLLSLALVAPALAQDGPGGQLLTFGVSQRLSYQSNPDLGPGDRGDGAAVALTDLSFAFSDRTRTESFTLEGSSGLRLGDVDGPTVATPRLSFGYTRESADKVLSASGSWSRAEIERVATLSDFTDGDGNIDLPVDFDLLDPTIDGTRTNTSLRVSLEGGRTAPLGYTASARVGRITYAGDASSVLDDSQTVTLSGGVSLRLDEVTRAGLSLTYTQFDEDGSDTTDRLGFSANWRRERPQGPLAFSFSARDTEGGVRLGFNTSRSLEIPRLQLTFGAGVSGVVDGDWTATGNVSGRYALPNAAVNFGARRSFATAADGADRQVTNLTAGYTRPLSPLGRFSTDFGYLETSETDGRVRTLNLSAAYAYQLTEDWALSTGITLTERRETGFERARGETVFVSLNRSFAYRP